MKKVVKASKFENQVWLVDKYDNPVIQLVPDGYGYWNIPTKKQISLSVGDIYYVKEFESEID